MDTPKNDFDQVSTKLLSFLKEKIADPKINFSSLPVKLEGGNETSIFHFRLKSVPPSLSGPLVLRQFRKEHRPNHAVMEKIVHNSLVDQGFPVPYVHYYCANHRYLGSQFLIMDFLTGKKLPLVLGPDTNIALGKTHADLHNADASRLRKDMMTEGFGWRQDIIEDKLDILAKASENLQWLREISGWLIENRPSEQVYPSICHGDYHPYNILAKDGAVSAIWDWSCCYIGDPAMDVASTLVVFKAATKHLIPLFDSDIETQKYLDAYKSERDLDERRLEYYQALGCATALLAGTNGVLVWTQPPIQRELIDMIHNFAAIRVEVPV